MEHLNPSTVTAQPSWNERVNNVIGPGVPLERDVELMLAVRAGDQASYAVLVQRHRNPVIHFIYRMVQNQAIAEELAQEVFLRVFRARGTYQPTAKFTTWLFRMAAHLALNWIRDGKHQKLQDSLDDRTDEIAPRQVADQGKTIEQELLHRAKLDEVRRAIGSLPVKQRAAVMMHKYEDMDYAQIANALSCSESAVKSLLFRAYESLRARLAHMA